MNLMGALHCNNIPLDVCYSGRFNKATDVWALGIIIFEMYNLSEPYIDVEVGAGTGR